MHSYRLLVVATSIDRSHLALFAGLRDAGVSVRLLFDSGSPRREEILRSFPEAGFLRVRSRLDLAAARDLRRRIEPRPPDILFAPEDAYVSLLARLNETDAEAVLGLFPTDEPWRTDVVEKDSAGRIRRIVVKPKQTALRESWVMAVWGPAFTQFLHDHLAAQAPPPAGPAGGEEAYVGHVLQAALEAGLRVESVSFPGGEFLDIGTPESLLRAVRRCIAGPSSF